MTPSILTTAKRASYIQCQLSMGSSFHQIISKCIRVENSISTSCTSEEKDLSRLNAAEKIKQKNEKYTMQLSYSVSANFNNLCTKWQILNSI